MKSVSASVLSTAAAIAGGIVQVHLPVAAAPARPSAQIMLSSAPNSPSPRLTADFTDVPVREALQQMFKTAHRQCMIAPDVHGNVSIKLTDMPFDLALQSVLKATHPQMLYTYSDGTYKVGLKSDKVFLESATYWNARMKLRYAKASDVRNQLVHWNTGQPGGLFPDATFTADSPHNTVVIHCPPAEFRKIWIAVNELDGDAAAVKPASTSDMAKNYKIVLYFVHAEVAQAQLEHPAGHGPSPVPAGARITAMDDNSLLIRATPAEFQEIRDVLKTLDVEPAATPPAPLSTDRPQEYQAAARIYKLVVQNIVAGELLDMLHHPEVSGWNALPRYARITLLKEDNALLVDATPDDWQKIRDDVKLVDIEPRQVRLAVWIADVTAKDLEALGVDLQRAEGNPNSKDSIALMAAFLEARLAPSSRNLLTSVNGQPASYVFTSTEQTCDITLTETSVVLKDDQIQVHLAREISEPGKPSYKMNDSVIIPSGETMLVSVNHWPGMPEGTNQLMLVTPTALPSFDQRRAAEGAAVSAPLTPKP